jgi:hypothetical protein
MRLMDGAVSRRAALLGVLAAVGMATAAGAATTLPPRKPGFWVTTMVVRLSLPGSVPDQDAAPIVTALCTNAATDAEEARLMTGGFGQKCSAFAVDGGGARYTISSTCADPRGGTMTMQGVVTLTGNDAIHVESRTSSAHMTGMMVGDSKWQGACPAGVMPGDIGHLQNGRFVKLANILNPPKTP